MNALTLHAALQQQPLSPALRDTFVGAQRCLLQELFDAYEAGTPEIVYEATDVVCAPPWRLWYGEWEEPLPKHPELSSTLTGVLLQSFDVQRTPRAARASPMRELVGWLVGQAHAVGTLSNEEAAACRAVLANKSVRTVADVVAGFPPSDTRNLLAAIEAHWRYATQATIFSCPRSRGQRLLADELHVVGHVLFGATPDGRMAPLGDDRDPQYFVLATEEPRWEGVLTSYGYLGASRFAQAVEEYAASILRFLLAALTCIHTTSLEVSVEISTRQARRAAHRQGALPLFSYHILHIPAKHANARAPMVGTRTRRSLHMRRGHLKSYVGGLGLFGRHHGVYIWMDHAVGRAPRIVVKDYRPRVPVLSASNKRCSLTQ